MATNLQHEDFEQEVEEIFQRSTIGWLSQVDLVTIYDRHANLPFPISNGRLGPLPFAEGVYLYVSRRFSDRFVWTAVNEPRRQNCRSGRHIQGVQVTHTEATLNLPNGGGTFMRRNYHRGDNAVCIVHYLIHPPPEHDGGAGDDGEETEEDTTDSDSDGAEEDSSGSDSDDVDGEETEEEDSSDSDSDDVDGDPDYDPELDEIEKVATRSSDKVLELKDPLRGLGAARKVQVSAICLTALHPDILEVDQPRDFDLYCYNGGMKCVGLKRFQSSSELHYNVVTAPMYQLNAIALEAYILVNLLIHSGQFSNSLPKCASSSAQRHLKNLCTSCYNDGKISELEVVVVVNTDFEKENNLGLIKQEVASLYKPNILRLTQNYLTLSLQDIVDMVKLANAKEADTMVIHIAARYGSVESIKELVGFGFGCDVNSRTDAGDTALLISTRQKPSECLKALALASAVFSPVNKQGHTVISVALEKGNRNMAGLLYALHCAGSAARRGDVKAVKLLSGKGYVLDVLDGDGYRSHGKMCEFLITHGANVYA